MPEPAAEPSTAPTPELGVPEPATEPSSAPAPEAAVPTPTPSAGTPAAVPTAGLPCVRHMRKVNWVQLILAVAHEACRQVQDEAVLKCASQC